MSSTKKQNERVLRARKMVAYLKRAYPKPKTELAYKTPFQLVASVMLSAQCTDKNVNRATTTHSGRSIKPYKILLVQHPLYLRKRFQAFHFTETKQNTLLPRQSSFKTDGKGRCREQNRNSFNCQVLRIKPHTWCWVSCMTYGKVFQPTRM